MKLLVIGYGGHGKDQAMVFLPGLISRSSSQFAASEFIGDALGLDYSDSNQCYEDRRNHRELWFHMIKWYNRKNPARLARELLATADCYVGMRSREEFEASKHLFDHIIWVDASKRCPAESSQSMELNSGDATMFVDNNGSLSDLEATMQKLYEDLLTYSGDSDDG